MTIPSRSSTACSRKKPFLALLAVGIRHKYTLEIFKVAVILKA